MSDEEEEEEQEDPTFSLNNITAAKTALETLEKLSKLETQEFLILTELTSTFCDSLWDLIDSKYPDLRKTSIPDYGILELKMPSHKKKEPDTAIICIRASPSAPGKSAVPSILVEAGYSQSYKSLVESARRILIGGAPAVQLVMIVKFSKRKLGVAVRLEFWRRDLAGTPYLAETRHVFPIPPTQQSPIFFTREELFGTGFIFPR
ncbi:hypothetical protein N7495_002879 [Penicillium taxi]|uniref:uncharacterized protein n=1 Tax=Penicillium taxi TaxID=168475 RepID=UPI0025454598|nr:uncharacterized protein N7495_002879 [Penicillium taxi]KAJ5902351.1 hypothetical protein N7495_002879 [Penicillium taxi]